MTKNTIMYTVTGIALASLLFLPWDKLEYRGGPTPTAQAAKPDTRPTIVFVSGLGYPSSKYANITNNLTKQGYKVIGYTGSYSDTSNYDRLINVWTRDVEKLVGTKKVIVIGHSVGGGVAVRYCATHKDTCLAGVNMDGSPAKKETLTQPFLYLQADTGKYCDAECEQGRTLMTSMVKPIHITGIRHLNFTDDASKPEVANRIMGFYGGVSAQEGWDRINKQLNLFLGGLKI